MSNVDRPNGFKVVGTLSGAPWTGKIQKFYSDTDNLFFGDIVEKDTAGQTSGDGAYPTCDRMDSGTGDIPLGVVVGWDPDPTNLENLYHPASTTYAVYICTDPDVILEAQIDDATLTDGTGIGLNYDVTIAAGDTSTGTSNMEIDGDSGVTTAATPLKIIGAVDRMDNDLTTANSRWLCIFNLHAYKSDAGTAGL